MVYIVSIVPNFRHRAERQRTVRALQKLPRDRVDTALEAFVREQKSKGGVVPTTVTLRELVAGGFLGADEAAPLSGMDVTVSTGLDDRRPQQILVRVRLQTGGVVVVMGDGSIQMVNERALEAQERPK